MSQKRKYKMQLLEPGILESTTEMY